MLLDALVSFGAAPFSIVAGAGVATRSSIIDLLGLGSGQAPQNIIGNATVFGSDQGIDWPRIQGEILITTAFTTGTAATMNFKFQGAPDTGAGGGYLPGTWVTLSESGDIPVADLDATGTTSPIDGIAWQFDFPPTRPINFMPRYLSILCQPAAETFFTAGAIRIPVTAGLDQNKSRFQARNYAVGPTS